jgi:hypothetical protein
MRVGGQRHSPAALPPGMTRYPLYRRLGRPQARSGRVLKISPPPGFDPRTLQLVASHYTDYAIPAFWCFSIHFNAACPISVRGRGSVVGIVTTLPVGRFGIRIPVGQNVLLFSEKVYTGSWPGCDVHSSPFSAEVEWTVPLLLLCAIMACTVKLYLSALPVFVHYVPLLRITG